MSFFHPAAPNHSINSFGLPHQIIPPHHPSGFVSSVPPQSLPMENSHVQSHKFDEINHAQSREGARRKIFIRTEEEQFALPLSKVETNNVHINLLISALELCGGTYPKERIVMLTKFHLLTIGSS